jgi:hypothetical protein
MQADMIRNCDDLLAVRTIQSRHAGTSSNILDP